MSKFYQVEVSNGVDTIEGMILPTAGDALEAFLQANNQWGDYPTGKIINPCTGEVYAHYSVEIDEDLNLTHNLWVSGEFNRIVRMEELMDALDEMLGGE